MFQESMIGCCGLNCSACASARGDAPCHGCAGPDEYKPEFCRSVCKIKLCEKRRTNQYRFCDECPDYPCAFTREHDLSCRSCYVSKESPAENLRKMRSVGLEKFLEGERERWTCVECGGLICAQDGVCGGCGRTYVV